MIRWRVIGVLALFVIIMSGCQTTAPQLNYQMTLDPKFDYNAKQYLDKAEAAASPERELFLLQAAGYLIRNGEYERAHQILSGLDNKTLSPYLVNLKQLTSAYLYVNRHQPLSALATLAKIETPEHLTPHQQVFYHELLAKAYLSHHNPLQSVIERLKVHSLLSSRTAQQKNARVIHQILSHLPIQVLDGARVEQEAPILKAWLELAYHYKKFNHDTTRLPKAIATWQQRHPNHPANLILPATASRLKINTQPEHIALLIPMRGNYRRSAQAIEEGFMAAYYKNPTAVASIQIYDTSQGNIQQIHHRASINGANFIVGPLAKRNVLTLTQHHINVPTLALNYLDRQSKPAENLFQFGLSPQDEAIQIANRAHQNGARRVLIIRPQDAWGKHIANTFTSQWQNLGGRLVRELTYSPRTNMARAVKDTLLVSSSYQRRARLEKTIATKVKFSPRRRQDFDVIFLVANPRRGHQIRPLLNFYYAGDVPIYATASIYSFAQHDNKDIEGITFCDIPWLIDRHQLNIARKTLPHVPHYPNNARARLYAMGYDAFHLATHIHQTQHLPDVGLEGATGRLYLDLNGKVRRELLFAVYRHGALHTA